MASIEQYQNGQAGDMVKAVYQLFENIEEPLEGSEIGDRLLKQAAELEPLKLTQKQAEAFIDNADRCAVGNRVCYHVFEDAPITKSVFLDELADGMVEAGRAEPVSKDEAKKALSRYPGYPIVISKVAGDKHMEICRTYAKYCFYWNMEKHGLPCLKKFSG